MEPEKSLADDDFIAVIQRLALAWFQTPPTINEGAVRGSEVLDGVLSVIAGNSRVTARDFCLRIVGIQVNVGEDTAVSVPTSNVGTAGPDRELLARGLAALDREGRVFSRYRHRAGALLRNHP